MGAVINGHPGLTPATFGENILGAGTRLVPGSAVLEQQTAPLLPGRYVLRFISTGASTDIAYTRQSAGATPVPATDSVYPLLHAEAVYLRVTGPSDNVVSVLFPTVDGFATVTRSDERP